MGSAHWFVLTGTSSAADRLRLLQLLGERACSVKRLADVLELECDTVESHLANLQANDLVEVSERDGVAVYRPTPQARQHWDDIAALVEDSPKVASETPTRGSPQ